MTIEAWPDLRNGTGEVSKNLKFFGARRENYLGTMALVFFFSSRTSRTSRSKSQSVNIILLGTFRMPPMPFPMPPLFITAVKDICAINAFEKLLNILYSEVYCWHFGFTTPLFSTTTTDMFLYDLLNLLPRWPLVFLSFLLPPLVARDVVTPWTRSPFRQSHLLRILLSQFALILN